MRFVLGSLSACCLWLALDARVEGSLHVAPAPIVLPGPGSQQQVIVMGPAVQAGGAEHPGVAAAAPRLVDLTRQARYQSQAPGVFTVDDAGRITAVAPGEGLLSVAAGEQTATLSVRVMQGETRGIDFERDILPIFDRAGCNSGGCHGKQRGQNGFQLSLLGFDPDFDYDALLKEARGRRVFPAAPQRSLVLQKASAQLPHGGGKRLDPDSAEYRTLLQWIASGAPRRVPEAPRLLRIAVEPDDRQMVPGEQQQVIVTAHYADGSTRDVTHLATFQSSEAAIARVDHRGLITAGTIVGEAAIMARYRNCFALTTVAVPLPDPVPAPFYASLPRHNFIDEYIYQKLARLNITPSEPAPAHRLLRRAYIDLIGRLPTADEARDFLGDTSADRYERLVDRLLQRPEYADHWANKWADLLRPNAYRVGIKTVLNYDYWIRDSFRKNKPYDQFVRELITAQGSTFRNGAVTLYRDRRTPDELTTLVSQLFLGIRLECAKCHHHPFEVWGQDDFYSFAAYFARVGRKGTGLSPPISGSEEMVFTAPQGEVRHPLTNQVLSPRPLFGQAPPIAEGDDPRRALAQWLTSDDNPYFVQVIANRVWADLMGRGLVEPVDDLRATNPPSNAPLLEALGDDFRRHGYDLKHLIRRIATSHAYRLSSLPNQRNLTDTRNYSRRYRERLRAEVLLDAVTAITQVPESFQAMPPGSRAAEIWTHRIESLFLDAFGRPDMNQDPPCERTPDTSMVQVLHLMNSENVFRKVTSDQGRAARLAASDLTPAQIVEELYLLTYSRFPDPNELAVGSELFEKSGLDRRQATEDLLWALLNTPEFIFRD
jgi:hypothetical protein